MKLKNSEEPNLSPDQRLGAIETELQGLRHYLDLRLPTQQTATPLVSQSISSGELFKWGVAGLVAGVLFFASVFSLGKELLEVYELRDRLNADTEVLNSAKEKLEEDRLQLSVEITNLNSKREQLAAENEVLSTNQNELSYTQAELLKEVKRLEGIAAELERDEVGSTTQSLASAAKQELFVTKRQIEEQINSYYSVVATLYQKSSIQRSIREIEALFPNYQVQVHSGRDSKGTRVYAITLGGPTDLVRARALVSEAKAQSVAGAYFTQNLNPRNLAGSYR